MLLDEFWFGFWEYWHGEKFGLGLYDKLLWVCAWIYLWRWANFVGMKFDLWKNFVGYVMLILGEFVWL